MEDLLKQLAALSEEERAALLSSLQPQTEKKPAAKKPVAKKKVVKKAPAKKKAVEQVEAPPRSRPKRVRKDEAAEYQKAYGAKEEDKIDARRGRVVDVGRGDNEGKTCRTEGVRLGKRPNDFESAKFARIKDEARREESNWED